MKKACVSALLVLAVLASLWGCGRSYTLLDVPKELKIDAASLSEDADNLMPVDDSTPLLAALPKEGLYVYATDQTVVSGVLIKYDGLVQYFPWRFAPRLARPDLFVSDYNEDGKKDIAFTFVSKAGANVYRENLHVLLRGEKGFTDNFYACEKAVTEAGSHLSAIADSKTPDAFTVYVDGTPNAFKLPGHGEFLGLYLDDVQDFTLGDEISLRVEPGMVFKDEGLPVFDVLTYTAGITFVDGILTQTNAAVTIEKTE